MNNWKEAYDRANEHVAALEEHKNFLRDEAIRIANERDEWKRAYEAAMRPDPVY